jgi:hypothetical protein
MVKRSRKDLFVTQPPLFFDTPKPRGLSRGALNVPRYRQDYLERREMEEQQIKRCITCKIVKPYSEFYSLTESRNLRLHTVGGVTNECKRQEREEDGERQDRQAIQACSQPMHWQVFDVQRLFCHWQTLVECGSFSTADTQLQL